MYIPSVAAAAKDGSFFAEGLDFEASCAAWALRRLSKRPVDGAGGPKSLFLIEIGSFSAAILKG